MGLAFPALSAANKTFIEQLEVSLPDVQAVFTFCLTQDSLQDGSTLTIGSLPDDETASVNGGNSSWNFVPLMDLKPQPFLYWLVEITGMDIPLPSGDIRSKPLCRLGDCIAIVDTGTSMLGVPYLRWGRFRTRLEEYVADMDRDCQLPADGAPGADLICEAADGARCCGSDDLPSLTFDMPAYDEPEQQVTFVVPSTSYVRETGSGSAAMTQLLIQQVTMSLLKENSRYTWILGDTFIKTYVTAFDYSKKRVSGAQSNARFARRSAMGAAAANEVVVLYM